MRGILGTYSPYHPNIPLGTLNNAIPRNSTELANVWNNTDACHGYINQIIIFIQGQKWNKFNANISKAYIVKCFHDYCLFYQINSRSLFCLYVWDSYSKFALDQIYNILQIIFHHLKFVTLIKIERISLARIRLLLNIITQLI